MAIRIGSNISSLQAQRRLSENSFGLSKTFERLSSGQRINSASDDAAGLAVAISLNTGARVFSQAARNVSDGISYLEIADGALKELSNITARQTELAEQSANGIYTLEQRRALTAEANALVKEFNRVVQSAEFNGRQVLDVQQQSSGEVRIQLGYEVSGSIAFALGSELDRPVGTGEFSLSDSITTMTTGVGSVSPAQVTAADINGDGFDDLITLGQMFNGAPKYGEIGILINDGAGNFSLTSTMTGTSSAVTATNQGLVSGDVDNDGDIDLLVGGSSPESGIELLFLRNDGTGTFTKSSVLTGAAALIRPMAAADLNGDGFLDFVNEANNGNAGIYFGDGTGSFSLASSFAGIVGPQGAATNAVAVADVTGDGIDDILFAGSCTIQSFVSYCGQLSIFQGDGQGSFTLLARYTAQPAGGIANSANSLDVADVNGDGLKDVVVGGQTNAGIYNCLFLNSGGGTFSMTATINDTTGMISSGPNKATFLADINGDGFKDLASVASANFGSGSVGLLQLYANDGSGSFSFSKNQTFSYAVSQAAVLDARNNEVNDFAFAPSLAGTYTRVDVFQNAARQASTIAALDLFTQKAAKEALTSLRSQQERLGAERGLIGGSMSRLASAMSVVDQLRINYKSAQSRIEDADVALESANLVRGQILQQVTAAVLAQANQEPRLAIQLLGGK